MMRRSSGQDSAMYVPARAHSPPIPVPAMNRYKPNVQTLCAVAASAVKMEKVKIVAARTFVRPNRSARGPQRKDNPQPVRKTANRMEPANPTLPGVAAKPDFGKSSVKAGASTSAYMKESMPSSVHPAHAPQKPTI